MSFADKSLHCVDCKKIFTFSAQEQQFHAARGFPNIPVRCPLCRQARKSNSIKDENAGEDFSSRQKVVPVTCSSCGKAIRVPFHPRPNEPVYCSDCYIKSRAPSQNRAAS
jgi:CxxC-x17-CxxC domain-containing protein